MKKILHILFLLSAPLWALSADALVVGDEAKTGLSSCQFDCDIFTNSDVEVCFDQRMNVLLDVEVANTGIDTLPSLSIDWYIAADLHGTGIIGDPISPGTSSTFSVPAISFSSEGSYNVSVKVTASCNGVESYFDSVNFTIIVLSPFEVDVLTDTVVCANSPFVIEIPNGLGDYEWNTGAITNKITTSQPGNFDVMITDEYGCQAFDSIVINHFQAPIDLVADTVLCDGDILTTDVGTGFETYIWSNGLVSNSIQITQDGQYFLSVTDSNGCEYVDSMDVEFAPQPSPSVPALVSVCAGDTAIIGTGSSYSSYYWNTGDTTSSISIYSSGTYIITVVGSFGCIGIDTVNVSVMPLPDANFSDSVMCNNNSYVMDVGQWYPSLQWSTGDTTQNLLVSTTGLYTVSITDLNGCHSIDSINVTNINIGVNLGPDDTICVGAPFWLVPPGSFDTYTWSDGSTGSTMTISSSGTYTVTVTKDVCYAIDQVIVTVEPVPIADFMVQVSSPDVQFTNASNSTYDIVWSFGDGDSSSLIDPFHQYAANGTYTVVLEVTNSCQTVAKIMEIMINPQGAGNIYINSSLKIFPTMATSQIQFSLDVANNKKLNYGVYDAVGKLLYRNSETYFGPDYLYQINISQFSAGTYFLRIVGDESLIAVKPFIKQ